MDFWSNLESKINPKSVQNSIQRFPNKLTTKIAKCLENLKFLYSFCYFGHLNMGPKIIKNRADILQKVGSQTMLQLASILDPTWLHFGRVLAPKLVPTSPQDTLKSHSQNHQKTDHILDRLWKDFWWILASKLGPFLVDFLLLLGFWSQLGPRWRPEPSKRASGTDFGGFGAPTWWIWGNNLLDFAWILNPSCLIFDAVRYLVG